MFIDEKKIEFLVDYFIGKHTLSCMGLGLTPLQQEVQKTLVRTGRIEGHTGSQEASLMQKTGKPYREEGLTDFETRLVDSMKRDIAVVKSIADLVAKVLEIDAEKYTKKSKPILAQKVQKYAGKIHDMLFQTTGVSMLTRDEVNKILAETDIEKIREQLSLFFRFRRQLHATVIRLSSLI